MVVTFNCPLCNDNYDTETDLCVHLEVNHRKSELAAYIVDRLEAGGDPTVEQYEPAPTA